MTSVAWAIVLAALLASDAFYTSIKPQELKYYEGVQLVAALILICFGMLILCTVRELTK